MSEPCRACGGEDLSVQHFSVNGHPYEPSEPCPDCEKESAMLREVGVADEAILAVPRRYTCGHEPGAESMTDQAKPTPTKPVSREQELQVLSLPTLLEQWWAYESYGGPSWIGNEMRRRLKALDAEIALTEDVLLRGKEPPSMEWQIERLRVLLNGGEVPRG